MSATLTGIVIARNEAAMIANCVDTLRFCDEILLINNGSTDETEKIAENMGVRVINLGSDDFAKLRNEGLKRAKTDWVIYIDADERVTPELAAEIKVNIETSTAPVFSFYRQNYCYGNLLNRGGFGKDLVTRVFKREILSKWQGKIHESPVFTGEAKVLTQKLIHLTHRSTQENLHKSAEWTLKEAELLYEAKVPPVTLLTLLRKFTMELLRRAIFKRGYQDGMTGWVEAIVQGMNRVMVYLQVWELQARPNIKDKYEAVEKELARRWKNSKI